MKLTHFFFLFLTITIYLYGHILLVMFPIKIKDKLIILSCKHTHFCLWLLTMDDQLTTEQC